MSRTHAFSSYNPHGRCFGEVPVAPPSRSEPVKIPRNAAGLRLDGPTLAQYVAAGYKANTYPPRGYARRP